MNNIGNDIIDLKLAKTQSNWQRKGFLEKQFTDNEIYEILNSENPFLQVWLFWSMKEAAYKCYTQAFKKRFFSPKKFECKLIESQKGFVSISNQKYHTKYLISDNYIHTVAYKNNVVKMVYDSFFIDEIEYQSQNTNQKLLSFFKNDVKVRKNEIGVPFLYQKNKKMPISVTTSHHGNYGAFAFSHFNE